MNRSHKSVNKISFIQNKTKLFLGGECPELSFFFLSIMSIIQYSLEGLMLKLQYFGHLMRRTDSLEKTLMLGKIEGRRRMG